MKRNVVVGAGLFILVLAAWGCADLLGVPEGEWVTPCKTGSQQCAGNTVQECVHGLWAVTETCVSQTCVEPAACVGVCAPAEKKCDGKVVIECDGGKWQTAGEACPFVCENGACAGECVPGTKQCASNAPQECDTTAYWKDTMPCTRLAPYCDAGTCTTPPSCAGMAMTCGPSGVESCCAVTVVPGGMYNRSNDPAYPATVNSFWMDRFEITVGRFRKFVEAYPGSKPKANAGTHPLIAGSGWDSAWDESLPVDQLALMGTVKCHSTFSTWTDTVGANENQPMNCLSWYEAFAFCAWDGGRLPTEAEWNYAAAGGSEQREYPWSDPPNSTTIDASYAVYHCQGDGSASGNCVFADILNVGSKSPKGDGRWGQADLGGSIWEWNLDGLDTYSAACDNCANTLNVSARVDRGGDWNYLPSVLLSSERRGHEPDYRSIFLGARCTRTPF